MTTFQPGDLVLVAFPFAQTTQTKVRPALVVFDTGDQDFVAARVTSQAPATPYDVPLNGWQPAGLLGPSVVRLHKLATLEKSAVRRTLGQLTPADRVLVSAVLAKMFGSW